MSKLLLITGDLMLLSRLEGVARACNLNSTVAGGASQAIESCDADCPVAIIDLETPGLEIGTLVAQLREKNPQLVIVAAGPHVHELRLAEAREAGCDAVVSRGQLDREAESIVERLLA